MAIHYNLRALSSKNNFTVYDLSKAHVIGASTCSAIYRQMPIQTDTLERILNYCDCGLSDFLQYIPETDDVNRVRKLDFNGMIDRGVISRTSKHRFRKGLPMSLSTLSIIAEDQGVNLLDFLREKVYWLHDSLGNLKKKRDVIYLCEW